MNIPLVDLKRNYASIKDEINTAILGVLQQTSFILGDEVSAFEKEFADFHKVQYCIGVDSGTSALRLALEAVGIEEEDEVIIPPNTFIATALAISSINAKPVFVDINEKTYLLDENKIEKAITRKTKAIIPVHLYGHPCNMVSIMDIAKKYNLRIIEDACQAHGAKWDCRKVGTFGDIGCFSFYPGKNLGAYGDGGAIITNTKEMAEKVQILRNYGQKQKYIHLVRGYNARLDSLQAAVLLVKLRYLEEWNNMREANVACYEAFLQDLDKERIILPSKQGKSSPAYHLYVVRVKERDRLQEFLKDRGISTGIHYPIPLHRQPAYADLGYKDGSFPVAEKSAKEILSLPLFPELKKEEIAYVCNAIKEFTENIEEIEKNV